MMLIKTMAKMNEFVEHYDTLFVTQNGIYSDSGKTTRSENMILSQLKMGEHHAKYRALMMIETMVTPTMVMEGLSLRNMMTKG